MSWSGQLQASQLPDTLRDPPARCFDCVCPDHKKWKDPNEMPVQNYLLHCRRWSLVREVNNCGSNSPRPTMAGTGADLDQRWWHSNVNWAEILGLAHHAACLLLIWKIHHSLLLPLFFHANFVCCGPLPTGLFTALSVLWLHWGRHSAQCFWEPSHVDRWQGEQWCRRWHCWLK